MFKLIYYVPDTHLDLTKTAVFNAGAGTIGNYEHCAWQVLGTGQFKPLKGANPFIGTLNALEQVAEWRVEMMVTPSVASEVLKALKASHPYEEPAFEFIQLVEIADTE
ncbi:MAG: YqfO family protein [Acinetobacter sp.]|uniref:YqfO family protein n=1 Tax=Acinetobacter sp. TaxID=472 RepID=UPI00257F432D|nr:YqfO family protein [Acinetobacter sp.]MBR5558038.1 YqfO family protein [Acinetobacter sp.]